MDDEEVLSRELVMTHWHTWTPSLRRVWGQVLRLYRCMWEKVGSFLNTNSWSSLSHLFPTLQPFQVCLPSRIRWPPRGPRGMLTMRTIGASLVYGGWALSSGQNTRINFRPAGTSAWLLSPRLMKPHTCPLLWGTQTFFRCSAVLATFYLPRICFYSFKHCHQV